MLTVEQINQIREKSGLPPKKSGTKPLQSVGRFDHLFPEKKGLDEAKEDVGQTSTAIKNIFGDTKGKIQGVADAEVAGEQGKLRSFGQAVGAIAGGVSKGVGELVKGAVKTVLPQSGEDKVKQGVSDTVEAVAPLVKAANQGAGDPFGRLMAKFNSLDEKSKRDVDGLLGVSSLAAELAGSGLVKKAGQYGVKTSIDVADKVVNLDKQILNSAGKMADKIGNKAAGPIQKGTEILERVPRAIDRAKESSKEAAIKAEKIKSSSPEVAKALKVNLDERIINAVVEADDATKKAYKSVVDIAEEAPKSLGVKKQPSLVSGELASKQFDIINKQRKQVGQQLGEKIKELSKTDKIDMGEGFRELDDVLSNQGINLEYTEKGAKLDFSGTKYTPAERTKIQELYNLATEGGASMSPSSVHGKDQLFSKLQRESAMEGIGKIMIDTPDGVQSLFGVFRDVFSKNLDDISPEIRGYNKQYRDLLLVIEDIEDSIFKTPNFNITKSADQAEFAKVNLRRIFGEAQSSPVFEAVADKMDEVARQLGYADASPKAVANFAEELRKLYPENIPKTGFQGGIVTGVNSALNSIVDKTLSAGAPDFSDRRKALIELLNKAND